MYKRNYTLTLKVTRKNIVVFQTPLTIIVGPNGSRKTTIIECLKYTTTDDLPPGAKVGGAFIHDPTLVNETEVKGQVKLQFNSVNGRKITCTRSMKAKINLLVFQLVVLTLTVKFLSFLSLSEPTEIFAATRWTKAIANITELRKTEVQKLCEDKISLEQLRIEKERAAKIEESQEINELIQTIRKLDDINAEIIIKNKERNTVEKQIDELSSSLKEMHDKIMHTQDTDRKSLERQKSSVDQGISTLRSLNTLHTNRGQLQAEQNTNDQRIENLENLERAQQKETELNKKYNKIRSEIDSHRQSRQNIKTIVKYGKQASDAREIQRSIDENLKYRRLQKTVLSDSARYTGVLKQLEEAIRRGQNELNTEYKDINDRYADQFIVFKTSELGVKDLEIYCKVLDNATMRFHTMNMEKINKIIAELW
ncbi:712_t:CDS:2, partial [Dentiscutata erythropus]